MADITLVDFMENYSFYIIFFLLAGICAILFALILILRERSKIQKIMHKDPIMDIWNLNYLIYQGNKRLRTDRNKKFATVTINIAQFRSYNLLYGWDMGEKLLEYICMLLNNSVDSKTEIASRVQGDSFVLFLEWENWENFMTRLRNLQNKIQKSIYNLTENHLRVRMGVYALSEEQEDMKVAVNYSNQALSMARSRKCSEIKVFDRAMEEKLRETHEREKMLEKIEIDDRFVAYYQNKVDIRTNRIIGGEALVRFLDPLKNGKVESPAYFVPYYEQTGKITEIDFHIMESVCKMLRKRLDEGKTIVPISVNFSRLHFIKKGFPERFEAILEKYGIDKDYIEVEITETLMIEELMQQEMIKSTLDALKEKGIRLSIDDFGSGYSSLGVFEKIPASIIKLDRSFFMNQQDRERQIKIMRGIVMLGHELEAQTVCEGIETEEDIQIMKEIKTYIAQGYYFSKPIPQEEFEKILDRQEEIKSGCP